MIGGFFFALFMGHIYILLIITAIQIISFKEVIAIANVPTRARDLQSTKVLNWYWLATTMYFLYGESVIYCESAPAPFRLRTRYMARLLC